MNTMRYDSEDLQFNYGFSDFHGDFISYNIDYVTVYSPEGDDDEPYAEITTVDGKNIECKSDNPVFAVCEYLSEEFSDIEPEDFDYLGYLESMEKDFRYKDITGVDFSGMDLSGANFRYSVLENCNLSNTNLKDVNFKDAQLIGCNLTGAKIDKTDMTNCLLQKTTISNATIQDTFIDGRTQFIQCDLANTKFEDSGIACFELYFGACDIDNCEFHSNDEIGITMEMSTVNESFIFGRAITDLYFSQSQLINSSVQGSLGDGNGYAFADGSKIESSAFFVDLDDVKKIDFSGCAKLIDVETPEGFELPEVDMPEQCR